jgi:6-phosphogluconolactonase (cycloisomerase 2 family)
MDSSTALRGLPAWVVGGYTADMGGSATGLTLFSSALAAGGVSEDAAVTLASPSYLIRHPDQPWLFAVSESSPSTLSSLRLTATGLVLTATVETGGEAACHLALSRNGQHILVAHYGSGSVASVGLRPDGTLSERLDLLTFAGSGPDPERQQSAHAHQVVRDGDEVLVCDLGTDRVHRLTLDSAGRLRLAGEIDLPPGSGPRHCVVRANYLVVACELAGTLWAGARTATGWHGVAELPASTRGGQRSVPSALVADGDRLFLANRGPGTVSVFDLDQGSGRVSAVTEFDCGGRSPRDLALTADRLWVANQAENLVTVYDRRTLPPVGDTLRIPTPSPACVVPLDDPGVPTARALRK